MDGKRKRIKRVGGRTKKEAESALRKALEEYHKIGMHFDPSNISVADYLDFWFDNYCKIELKYNTQLGYLSIIENHLKPNFGRFPVGNRYHIPLLIGWNCGLRISETFELTWDDIDFGDKTLTSR